MLDRAIGRYSFRYFNVVFIASRSKEDLRPMYQQFTHIIGGIPKADLPHTFYVIAGAGGVIFCAADESKRVTGIIPGSRVAIERRADYLANLMAPECS